MGFLIIKFPDGTVMKYDPIAHVAYLKVKDGLSSETREVAHNIMVDLDSKGHLLGVEIISPRQLKFETKLRPILKKIADEFHVPGLRQINPQMASQSYQPA